MSQNIQKKIPMRKLILGFTIILTLPIIGYSQLNCTTIKSGTTNTTTCYHKNGKESTVVKELSTSPRWYLLKIYDSKGKELFSREYGLKWGSSGIDLSYHSNGQVKSVHYTMQPDGGIQRTDITTHFNDEGIFEREEDRSLGNNGLPELVLPDYLQKKPAYIIPKENTLKVSDCLPVQTPFDFYLINNTSSRLNLTCSNQNTYGNRISKQIDAGDTIFIETYYSEPGSPSPLKFYNVELRDKPKRGYNFQIKHLDGNNKRDHYAAISLRRIRK